MKKLLALAMAMIMVLAIFIVVEATDGAYTYSSSWKLEVESTNDSGSTLSRAFDGKSETYYHSWFTKKDGETLKDACPHTITVTFDKALEISSISYLPRQINGNDKSESGIWKKAEIYGSTDGKTFKKLTDVSYDVAKTRDLTTTNIPKNNYKAIRFVVTDSVNGYCTIAEIEFFGGEAGATTTTTTPTTPTTTPATGATSAITNNGWKIEASSAFGTGNSIDKAFDGNEKTIWHSNYTVKDGKIVAKEECPHTITVTFDKATEVAAVTYLPRQLTDTDKSGSGIWKRAEIYGSKDGSKFTKLCDVTYDVVATRALTTTEIKKDTYKAIRIVVTESQSGYGTAAEIGFLGAFTGATEEKKEEAKEEAKTDAPLYEPVKVTYVNVTGAVSKDAYEYNSSWDITVSSSTKGSAERMFDGEKLSYWHSWFTSKDGVTTKAEGPHEVTIVFPEEKAVSGIRYTPRQLNGNDKSTSGIAILAEVHVTTDGEKFTKIAQGNFTYASGYAERETQEIKFDTVKVKGIKFVITQSVSGYGTCAELEVLKGEGAEADIEELTKEAKKNNKFITMQIDSLDAKIGDKEVKLVKAPQIVDGRTLVPVRFVSESLGAVVGWNGETREVSIMDGTNNIVLEIDSPYVMVNGKVETLDVPAMIIDNSTMVPIRFVSETLGANVEWDGETRTVTIDKPMTIACWGDSLTYGDGATSSPYPTVLAKLSGLKTLNLGIGGESALTIAARQGAYDISMSEDFVIPESGSVDLPLVTFKEGTYLTTPDGGQVCPRATSAKWNPCYINGVEGTLSIQVDTTVVPRVLKKATFTRKQSGEAVEVKKGDLLIPSASYVKADINVIYIGANGIWDEDNTNGKNTKEQADKLIAMINRMIENTPDPEKFIVVGFTWSGKDSWSVVDAEMEKAFGRKFVSTKSYMSSEQALKDMGVTPTEADLADIKLGRVPESFRKSASDGTHLNDLGYTILGTKIYERMIELGYIVK